MRDTGLTAFSEIEGGVQAAWHRISYHIIPKSLLAGKSQQLLEYSTNRPDLP